MAQAKLQNVAELVKRVKEVGRKLTAANPRELAVGNIVRRLLGLVREVNEAQSDFPSDSQPSAPVTPEPVDRLGKGFTSGSSRALASSLEMMSSESTTPAKSMKDVKDDVLNGMREMLDELDQADEQIAAYSLEHIHPTQTILTYPSSTTIQKFLLHAAKRRKFTVIQVEGFPNEHRATYESVVSGRKKNDAEEGETENRLKTLTAMGITVIVVPDSAIFAVMSRVNSVLLPAYAVLPDGSFVGAAGVKMIAQAAKAHGVPVTALGAIYKVSPVMPKDPEILVGFGDSGKTLEFADDELSTTIEIVNPTHDLVPTQLVDVFVTNMWVLPSPFPRCIWISANTFYSGAHAPSFMYRIVADHYRQEDVEL